jgi:hypothetical protein
VRSQVKLLTAAAGLTTIVLAATGAILAVDSSVQASSLPETTIQQVIRSSDAGTAPVRQVRAVRPDRFADSCEQAAWPYIPEECLKEGAPRKVRVLK